MSGERTKTEYHTRYTTGVVSDEFHNLPFYRCRIVELGCQEAQRNTITYGVGGKFNNCSHVRSKSYVGIPAFCSEYTQRAIGYTGGRYYPTPTPPTYELLDSKLEYQRTQGYVSISTTPEEIELKRYDAYNKLIHLTPSGHMNVLRSAMELKDTKQTITGMLDFVKWGKTMLGRTVVLRGVAHRLSLLTNVVVFAEAYLTLMFGIVPTVSDVKQFLRELSEGKLRVKGSRAAAEYHRGDVVTARYVAGPRLSEIEAEMFSNTHGGEGSGTATVGCYTGSSYITVPSSELPYIGYSRAREVTVRREVGCYFAQLTRDLKISGLNELKRRWEWSCPTFRTLWDLCPFSFLVDWVVDVGAFIERLEKRYLMPSFEQYLGPIWLARNVQTRVYRPALDRFTVGVTAATPPSRPGSGGTLNIRWDWKAHAYVASEESSFLRGPTTKPTAIWPTFSQSINAYQISTGMALLLSAAKVLRK